MLGAAIFFSIILLIAALVQLTIAAIFYRDFLTRTADRLPNDSPHRAAILMSVRGCDPSFERSLTNLLQQDYRNYEVHLVIDHHTDPAWQTALDVKSGFDPDHRLFIHELQNPERTCGLKCSALIQGLKKLSPDIQYVATTDSDVTTHSTWLAELIAPLERDPSIGLTMGAQWFEPPAPATLGALVRSAWNAGAMVFAVHFRNPWAGSMAMRLVDIKRGNFAQTWRDSMVDDGPMSLLISQLGLKRHFCPSLIMVNQENCSFGYAHRWVTRMLTWSKLYEPTFYLSILHALFSNLVMLATFLFFFAGMATGSHSMTAVTVTSLISSGVLSVAAYLCSRGVVRRSCELSERKLAALKSSRLATLWITVPVTQFLYLVSCVSACFKKQIQWRGIRYVLRKWNDIDLIDYQPFIQTESNRSKSNHSI